MNDLGVARGCFYENGHCEGIELGGDIDNSEYSHSFDSHHTSAWQSAPTAAHHATHSPDPIVDARSTIITSFPLSANARATAKPMTPAPITTASTRLVAE